MYKPFRYCVADENENIEMEIYCKNGISFSVHFPRYELREDLGDLRPKMCFTKFDREQLGMFLFAYSPKEFEKFRDYLKKKVIQ